MFFCLRHFMCVQPSQNFVKYNNYLHFINEKIGTEIALAPTCTDSEAGFEMRQIPELPQRLAQKQALLVIHFRIHARTSLMAPFLLSPGLCSMRLEDKNVIVFLFFSY